MRLAERVKMQMGTRVGQERAFKTGEAVVGERVWGQAEDNAPREYGDYVSTSNAVYACITGRAQLLKSLPLRAYRFTKQRRRGLSREAAQQVARQLLARMTLQPARLQQRGISAAGLEEVTDGPLVDLLGKVNPFWTFQRLVEMSEMSLGTWGKAVWFVERGRNGRGVPEEIWWARSDRVSVIPHPTNYVSGFEYEPLGATEKIPYKPSETIWLNYSNPRSEFEPLSPLAPSRVYADYERDSMRANQNLHKQGFNAGGVVYPLQGETWGEGDAGQIESTINRRFRGVDKAHRWAVFRQEVGMKEFGMSPKDAEFLGGLNWSLEAVARAYKWPLDLIGGRRTYENLPAALRAAWTQAILPEAAFIAAELTEQLLPMFLPGEADLLWFDTSEVYELQKSENEDWDRAEGQIAAGAILINEWRESQGLAKLPHGDVWWAPANVMPVGSEGAGERGSGGAGEQRSRGAEERPFIPKGADKVVLGSVPDETEIAAEVERSGKGYTGYWDEQQPEWEGLLEAEQVGEGEVTE